MWEVFTLVSGNLGASFEYIIIFMIFFGGILVYAKDAVLGMMLHFLAYALVFIWFYAQGLNYAVPAVLMFMFLVLMSLTLYATSKATRAGSYI